MFRAAPHTPFILACDVSAGTEVRFDDGMRKGPWRYVSGKSYESDGWMLFTFADGTRRRVRHAQVVEVR